VSDPLPAGIDATVLDTLVSSRHTSGISDSLSIPIQANAELVATKSDDVTTFQAGDTLTYTIALSNVGNQGASGIVVTDTLPDHTAYVPGTASHGGVHFPENRQIVWRIAPSLPGRASITRTAQIKVNASLPEHVAQITNTVQVMDDGANGDTPAGNVALDVDTLDFRPALRIAKYGPAHAEIGDTALFTFTVSTVSFTPTTVRGSAIGDGSPIKGIRVSDSKAGPVRYVRGDRDSDGLLEMGEVWIYTASYTIKATDRGALVNIGTAVGRDINGDPVSATSSHTTIVAGQMLYLPLVVR
jgi:uncharacterized repeat protein (TIGR01451 family)